LLKETIRIVPLSSIKLVKTVQNKQADFVLANPIQTILLQRNPGYKPLLSMVTKEGKYYAGVIAVSKDSQIKTSEDLRGKKVIGMGKNSAGGHFFQVYHLQQRGINAYRDLAKFAFARNQDEALLALKVGQYDAAFVRTGMIENGLFDPDLFHLVDIRHDPDFNLPHSTALYPEWYVSAAPNTSPELQEKLTAVLKSIKPQQAAAKSTGLQGFIDPLPMHDVEQIVNSLSLH
jgi:ABC-type phosphate/phosphonate transport system substrate-binding protein